jgi:serine/threonine-protein kinase RsbW
VADQLKLTVKSRLAEIPQANQVVSQWLSERHAPHSFDYLANLAIEELVTNCIKYAYDDAAEHLIDIELHLGGREMMLRLIDDGRAFNPVEAASPDTGVAAEHRPIGGLGLHLLRKMCDRMEYARTDGKNRVTLWKRSPS